MKRKIILILTLAFFAAAAWAGGGRESSTAQGPVTITLSSNRVTATTGQQIWATDTWQAFQRQVNVFVDYRYYEVDGMSLMLASGDLTDMVLTNQRFLPNVFAASLAMKLDPIIPTHIPNTLLPMYKTRNEMLRIFLGGPDKGIYILSPGLGPENGGGTDSSSRGYSIRWDWYKEIGAPPIENDDQYVDAIRAIVARHPTVDGRKVWGMGLQNDLIMFFTHGMLTAKLNPWTIMNSQYMGDFVTNEIFNGYTDINRSAYWNDIKMYNKLHRAGLFDPDSFTQTVDETNAKINSGVYVATVTRSDAMYNEMRKTNPNTLAGHMLVPSSGTAVFADKPLVMGNAPDDSMFIFSKSRNWEAAARLLNVMQDPDVIRTLYSGFKGQHWDYDASGKPYLFDKFVNDYAIRTDEINRLLGPTDPPPRQFIFADNTARHPDGAYFHLFREPSFREKRMGLSPLYLDYANFYSVPYPSEAMLRNVRNGRTIDMSHDFVQLISVGMTDIPRDIERIIQNLNDILYRGLPRLVTAESDAAYNTIQQQVLSDLRAAGEPQAWEWVRTNYNRYKAQVDPVIRDYFATMRR